ncbi:hypothetical protein CR513_52574, partial [Mucuna pruriens]
MEARDEVRKKPKGIRIFKIVLGNLDCYEYTTKFECLSCFYSQPMRIEEMRHGLMRVIIPMAIQEFPKLVEKANVVECLKYSTGVGKTLGTRSFGFKKGHNQKKPYSRPHDQ